MEGYIFRDATIKDAPFLVETIMEAEKGGTDKLSYTTILGLTEAETRKYLTNILLEEVDGCELSISSFFCAETNGQVVAAVSEWIEGINGIPSSVLKGNLLSYTLPKRCIERALSLNHFVRDLHIEYAENSIQLGYGHVLKIYQGNNLMRLLLQKKIELLLQTKPDVSEAFAQVFECNIPSIRTCEKMGFEQVLIKESKYEEITKYLPYHKKILFRKEISTKPQ
jgi:hypothetical protein